MEANSRAYMTPMACTESDRTALDELFLTRAAYLRGTAARITGSVTEAEDIVQEAFLRLHDSGGVPRHGVATWLRTTVIRLSLMRLRSWRRRPDRCDPADWTYSSSAQSPADVINAMALDSVIAALPDKLRVVFVLHHVEGFSHPEIAEILRISVAASAKRLSRAVGFMRKQLED